MDPRKITEDFTVSPQIAPEDLPEISREGFRSVLCNRPDNEEAGQPGFDSIARAARDEGLEARSVPIVSGAITPEAVEEFRQALADLPGPVLAYCRSGTRCTMLWAIARHGSLPDAEIERRAAAAGYDVSGLLRQRGGQ